ncbi:phenylpyruvate tautomerase PptA (4-oxalocrotonate tautomerase family) [Nitrobacteraceae bacterium AZCC 2146]
MKQAYTREKEETMPLVKINLRRNRDQQAKKGIAEAVQAALVAVMGIPNEDLYQLINEYEPENFIHTDEYLGLKYSANLLMIEIAFIHGRSDELKKALLKDINKRLVATGLVKEDDAFVVISEVGRANVSFGKGLAQRAE